jgi:hypothetical protein
MYLIFYYTKLNLSNFMSCFHKTKCKFLLSDALHIRSFFFNFRKCCLIKIVHRFKIYQHTKFHGPTLTGASFASTSEV